MHILYSYTLNPTQRVLLYELRDKYKVKGLTFLNPSIYFSALSLPLSVLTSWISWMKVHTVHILHMRDTHRAIIHL